MLLPDINPARCATANIHKFCALNNGFAQLNERTLFNQKGLIFYNSAPSFLVETDGVNSVGLNVISIMDY